MIGVVFVGLVWLLIVMLGFVFVVFGCVVMEDDLYVLVLENYLCVFEVMVVVFEVCGVYVLVVWLLLFVYGDGDYVFVLYLIVFVREKGVLVYIGDGVNCWLVVYWFDVVCVYWFVIECGVVGVCYYVVDDMGVLFCVIVEVIGWWLNVLVVVKLVVEVGEYFGWFVRFVGMDVFVISECMWVLFGWVLM